MPSIVHIKKWAKNRFGHQKNKKKDEGGPNFAPKTPKMATKCNFGLERARDLILVSIPRFLWPRSIPVNVPRSRLVNDPCENY